MTEAPAMGPLQIMMCLPTRHFQGNAYFGFVLPAAPANSFVLGARTLEFGDVCECKFVSENDDCGSTFVDVGF